MPQAGSSVLCLLLAAISAFGADLFPSIEGDNLLGKKVVLPDAVKGHPAVVVVGFTRGSQGQIKAWRDRLSAGIDAWSIAILEDAPRLVRGVAIAGIRSGVPPNRRDRFVIVIHNEKQLKAALGFDRPDDAYVALIDRDGAIRWRFHGPVADGPLRDLEKQIATP